MGIESYLKRVCRQTAVYWSLPIANEQGRNVYADPVEIQCFWKNTAKLFTDNEGKEVMSKAMIHVLIDLDEQGMLFLGGLGDLTTAQKADPRTVSRAYEIGAFLKTPSLGLKEKFNRVAMI